MALLSVSTYCKREYGEKLYKLSLCASVSCPNRERGQNGCIFCSAGGSGDFAAPANLSVSEQIEFAKEKIRRKTKAQKYIAYFQSYTGTYGDLKALEERYRETAEREEIAVLDIATRPDCLGKEAIAMLKRLSEIKPLWIELGLQTSDDETARKICRGYKTAVYDEAVQKLRTLGVHIITHIILGLPGEDRATMLNSVRYAGKRCDGIKLQLLHVLRGTPLAEMYGAGEFETLSPEAYYDLVASAMALLPPETVIHRMTGDGNKKDLIAPLWSGDKKRVLHDLNEVLNSRNVKIL